MKLKMGRPSLYRAESHPAFAGYLAQEGKTEDEIAERLGVSTRTLTDWKQKYPEFLRAVKSSKEEADSLVEQSLYQKAVKGDVTACIYWLKCRQPAKWRDRQEIETSGLLRVEHSGKVELSDEEVVSKYADALRENRLSVSSENRSAE